MRRGRGGSTARPTTWQRTAGSSAVLLTQSCACISPHLAATHARFRVHCAAGDHYTCDVSKPFDEFWFTNRALELASAKAAALATTV